MYGYFQIMDSYQCSCVKHKELCDDEGEVLQSRPQDNRYLAYPGIGPLVFCNNGEALHR